ncbi:hypothetical protein [Trichothermofontia sp.]
MAVDGFQWVDWLTPPRPSTIEPIAGLVAGLKANDRQLGGWQVGRDRQ